jgi:hypothetical protein
MSCKTFFGGGLFRLRKGICEGCVGLDRVLVFLDTGGFCGLGLGLKLGFNMEPVGTSPMGRG